MCAGCTTYIAQTETQGHSQRQHWDGVFSNLKIPPTDILPLKELTCLPHFKGNRPPSKSSCFSAVAFP